jgi:hypothetical protein
MYTRCTAPDTLDEAALEGLVRRALEGDEEAWKALWLALAPLVEGVAGSWRVAGRLARCAEARSDVVIRVMGNLRADGFRGLADLGERLACRDGSFRPWLAKLAGDAAVDGVRSHPDYLGRTARRWAFHKPLRETMTDERMPESRRIEARWLLARCPEVLAPAQIDALRRWLEDDVEADATGKGPPAGGDANTARRVRSALARLRRWMTARRDGRGAGKKKIHRAA